MRWRARRDLQVCAGKVKVSLVDALGNNDKVRRTFRTESVLKGSPVGVGVEQLRLPAESELRVGCARPFQHKVRAITRMLRQAAAAAVAVVTPAASCRVASIHSALEAALLQTGLSARLLAAVPVAESRYITLKVALI